MASIGSWPGIISSNCLASWLRWAVFLSASRHACLFFINNILLTRSVKCNIRIFAGKHFEAPATRFRKHNPAVFHVPETVLPEIACIAAFFWASMISFSDMFNVSGCITETGSSIFFHYLHSTNTKGRRLSEHRHEHGNYYFCFGPAFIHVIGTFRISPVFFSLSKNYKIRHL